MFGFPPARAFKPTRWLGDGDTVQIGNETLQVRHCPGHTPGHVVFHAPQIQRCFVGDVLFAGSIGRTDFPQGNHQQLIDSIVQRLWPMGDETVFIPGHGPESSFGRERRSNPYVGGHLTRLRSHGPAGPWSHRCGLDGDQPVAAAARAFFTPIPAAVAIRGFPNGRLRAVAGFHP